jgi:hypothetical protein
MRERVRQRDEIRQRARPASSVDTAEARSRPLSARNVLALQRSAGNQAVGRLMRQPAPGGLDLTQVMPDSIAPDALPPGTAQLQGPEDAAGTAELGRMLARSARERKLQRKEADTLELCPRYWRYEVPRDVSKYNCAGLAWRTYDYRGDLAAERSAASSGSASQTPGAVKHWFWEYDLHVETDDGRKSPTSHDFHTVAGVVDKASADPDDVYSKNGARPVYGPGTGPSWKPPARDRATSNDPSETPASTDDGKPLYKVRTNFKEIVKLHPCPGP